MFLQGLYSITSQHLLLLQVGKHLLQNKYQQNSIKCISQRKEAVWTRSKVKRPCKIALIEKWKDFYFQSTWSVPVGNIVNFTSDDGSFSKLNSLVLSCVWINMRGVTLSKLLSYRNLKHETKNINFRVIMLIMGLDVGCCETFQSVKSQEKFSSNEFLISVFI